MSYKNRKSELATGWMTISDADAKAVAAEVAAEINAELPKYLPEGVILRDDITAEMVYTKLCNDRPWWNREEQPASLYIPVNYLVNYKRGTKSLVTSKLDLFNIPAVRIVSIGDVVLKKGGITGGGGEGCLSKIEADGTDMVFVTVDGCGTTTDVGTIMGKR